MSGMKKLDVLPGERCKKERLEYWECEIHMTNTLCSSVVVSWPWNLFIERGGRFYLRGVIVSEPRLIDRSRWIDFLPFMRQILSATQDLVMMPDVSDLKERIDFGKGQSFPGCGKLPRRRHNRRQVDNIDPDAAGFITRGNNAVKGNHPWHGSLSIYPENNNNTNEDFCGATLISNKTLITAAHCFSVVTNFSDLEVMHDSSYVGEDSQQTFKVSKLLIHPGYQILNNALHNDIALITLESEVQITDFVRPICLWNSDYDLIKIANKTSVVAPLVRLPNLLGKVCGWGLTSNHTQPVTLQEANVQVISYEDCYMSNKTFFSKYMLPRQNFCAGFPHNQTSACKGDSGGGLYLRERSKNFLRGVVSSGSINKVLVGKNKITTCDPNYYALFTDVANYMQWIVQNAPDINLPATP